MRYLMWSRALVVVYVLVSCLTALGHSARPNHEPYSTRPKIENVAAKAYDLGPSWQEMKPAHFALVAQVLEFYPDHEIYFLARDSELLFDAARLATANTADADRVHLLNISRRSVKDPELMNYLIEQGIEPKAMAAGRKILFVDTGFDGTISKAVTDYLPAAAAKNLQTHLIVSRNPEIPYTRSFLTHLGVSIDGESLPDLRRIIINSYERIPRFTRTAEAYEVINNTYEPVSEVEAKDSRSISHILALSYMKDIKVYWSNPETQRAYREQKALSRDIYNYFLGAGSASAGQRADHYKPAADMKSGNLSGESTNYGGVYAKKADNFLQSLSVRYGEKKATLAMMDFADVMKTNFQTENKYLQSFERVHTERTRKATAGQCSKSHLQY